MKKLFALTLGVALALTLGATVAVAADSAEVPDAGVVAASGGNFGVAVAYTAERLGLRAEIFVAQSSSAAKLD